MTTTKSESTATATPAPDPAATQVYEIYIRATPQAIWDAITQPEWTARYGYQGPVEYELRPGGAFRARSTPPLKAMGFPDVIVDGEVTEVDPPHKLVQTYRFLFSPAHTAEGYSRLTYEIAATPAGFTRLTVTHELAGLPMMAGMVTSKFSEMGAGGWTWILSDLKSLLETGQVLAAS
jgi:uncharacterized protein YndB with AHSA1/START domain